MVRGCLDIFVFISSSLLINVYPYGKDTYNIKFISLLSYKLIILSEQFTSIMFKPHHYQFPEQFHHP